LPTLDQRADGCFIVKHFYHDNQTWQIDADGVRYLNNLGIRTGDSFSTDLFMQLVASGIVYTSSRPRPVGATPPSAGTSSSDPELQTAAKQAFGLLYRREYVEVYKILAPHLRNTITAEDFTKRVTSNLERFVASCTVRLVTSFPIQNEHLKEIDCIGTVVIDFKLTDKEQYLGRKETWCRENGIWYWWWRDWNEKI
jgi:hypothetical protein